MTKANIYLNFNGNCEEAFNFYKSVLGGELQYLQRVSDSVLKDKVSAEDGNKILYVCLPVSEETAIMGSDVFGPRASSMVNGTNYTISLNVDTKEEADRVYAALSAGGNATMPLSVTFWGAYFGTLTDKFGIQWIVNCNRK